MLCQDAEGGWVRLERGILAGMPPHHNFASCSQETSHAYMLRPHAHYGNCGMEAHHLLENRPVSMLVDVERTCNSNKVDECIEHSHFAASSKCEELQNSPIVGHFTQAVPAQSDGHAFVALLKNCTKFKDLEKGTRLHAVIAKTGLLKRDPFVGNTLVDMYAKCGSISQAQDLFDKLEVRDVVSWNALIGGYVNLECGKEALTCFEQMQLEGMFPDAVTYVCSLKACGSSKAIIKGKEIHAKVLKEGLLERNIFVGNSLVDMYAKHGLLIDAKRIFNDLPVRDVVSWNALIAGYVKHEASEKALNCFELMQRDGIRPTAVTFVYGLKACAAIGAADKGLEIHAEIVQDRMLENNAAICVALIDMYVICGPLTKALDVFHKLPDRDLVSWTALIAGYTKHEHAEEVLEFAEQMRLEGICGNSAAFVCRLKACGMIRAVEKGTVLHIEISEAGLLERDAVVGNALVDMYAKCGWFPEAYKVLVNLSVRDVVTWTALMAGYIKYEHNREAINCFEEMQLDGVSPNEISFVCGLKACSSIGATERGAEIHAEIARKGLLNEKLVVGNALVDMYAKFGFFAKAREVFDLLSVHDVVSWTALIAGYTSHECCEQALSCFEQMKLEGVSANSVTIVCSLQACCSIGATDKGRELHAEIVGKGFLESDVVVGNALINMYAKSGVLSKAREVFDNLSARDVASWTALIAGYIHNERGKEALICFEHMQLEGISPNAITFICSLKACGSIGATGKGSQIHAEILKLGIMGHDLAVGNALVDMYAKCGFLEKAQEIFDQLVIRDLVSWNSLISGYAKHNHAREALYYFEEMQFCGISPDPISFVSCLKACGSIGAIHKGCEVHVEIARKGLYERDPAIGNALIDMYATCGFPAKAQDVFDNLLLRDTVSWTSLITAYAQLGRNKPVFSIFDNMRREGRKLDTITFLSVLKTCLRACLVEKGQVLFEAMSKDFGLVPPLEHHTCLADLLGQEGRLGEAVELIRKMPFDPDLGVWHTLLDICQNWGNVELGWEAFENAVRLDEKNGVAYVRMSNTFVGASMHDNTNHVEAMSVKNKAGIEPGHCQFLNIGEYIV